jgi:hypothetical protein
MFPSLSRISVPLLGADKPTASSGPPRDNWRRVPHLVPTRKGPPGVIRIRVLTTAVGTPRRQSASRRPRMRGAATLSVAPRRESKSLRHDPKPVQDRSCSPRLIQLVSPHWHTSGVVGLETGPRVHRRSLPGHTFHHHSGRRVPHAERSQQERRSRRSDAAGSVGAPGGCVALGSDPRRRHRRSAASKPSDQELGERELPGRELERPVQSKGTDAFVAEPLPQLPPPPEGLHR